jgi:chitin disaccharide deacetylase
MTPNPVLRKLGLADDDRAVIIHMDDVGSCQAANGAYTDLVDFGLISSASVMVPCPWFPQAAAFCRTNPNVDMGVHLTLTSEWDAYRWGPISTRDPASGLLDEEGYFYRFQPQAQEHATPEAVYVELKSQIDRALAAGIDVTHIDNHMGTLVHAKLAPIYAHVALEYRLPPSIILRGTEENLRKFGVSAELAQQMVTVAEDLENQGVPLLDNIAGMPLDIPEDRLETAKQIFAGLPVGITHLVLHPCQDSPELRASMPDWQNRVGDYEVYQQEELRQFIREQGIHIIGNRALRDLMRAAS